MTYPIPVRQDFTFVIVNKCHLTIYLSILL